MIKLKFRFINSKYQSLKEFYNYIKINNLMWMVLIGFVLFVIAIIFSFIAFAPALSPFIYPLL